MQCRKFSWLIVLSSLWFTACVTSAQQSTSNPVLRENERGEKIIVYPDGRWQYFHQYNQGSKVLFDPEDDPSSQPRQAFNQYPVFTGKVVPYEEPIPITQEDAQKIAVRKSQIAQSAVAIANERAEEARRNRERLERKLTDAERRQADSEKRKLLGIRLEAARKAEATAVREAQQALGESSRARELAARGNYQEIIKETRLSTKDPSQPYANQDQLSGQFYQEIAALDKGPDRESLQFNTLIHPPAQSCKLSYEGVDEYTGMMRRDVQKQLLFTHTDERLRLYLKDKDYLRCEGFMTSLAGGYRYLSLEFTFAYPNAREAYGFIEKGSYLIVKLMDGKSVYLQSGKMDQGSYDTEKELLTYQVHYPINQSVINSLKRGEVDNIRMYWSSGFEEYEVYYLNFFIDQIRCLEKD